MSKTLRFLISIGLLIATGQIAIAQSPAKSTKLSPSVSATASPALTRKDWEAPAGETIRPARNQDVESGWPPRKARKFWSANCSVAGRVEAVRAARKDALGRLTDRIKQVHVTPEMNVQSFVREPEQIDKVARAALKAARETGVLYHTHSLIVEVETSVKLRTVYAALKGWAERYRKDDRDTIKRLEQLVLGARDATVREMGIGAPPANLIKADAPASVVAVAAMARQAPPWISQKLRAEGSTEFDPNAEDAASARDAAMKAAELDAYRKLSEKARALMIAPDTSVKDFAAGDERVAAAMKAFCQGAQIVPRSQRITQDNEATVVVEIDLRPLWDMIILHQRKLEITLTQEGEQQ